MRCPWDVPPPGPVGWWCDTVVWLLILLMVVSVPLVAVGVMIGWLPLVCTP